MPTIQLKMTDDSYDELKTLADEMGESSVASLARTGLGLLHFLQRQASQGYEFILINQESGDKEKIVFPLKKGI